MSSKTIHLRLSKQAVLLKYSVYARKEELIDIFMKHGPNALRKHLKIDSVTNPEWRVIFDYFVVDQGVLMSLIKAYTTHFIELYEDNGPAEIRKLLKISSPAYDLVWAPIHDLIGVSHGSLLKYAFNNRFSLNRRLHVYGADSLREYLGIDDKRYDETWKSVLDIMLQTTVAGYISKYQLNDMLKIMTASMNERRVHRAIPREK